MFKKIMRMRTLMYSICVQMLCFLVAGSNCEIEIDRAEELFRTGQFDRAREIISKCLAEDTLRENEKVGAYRLLALVYIAQNNPAEAHRATTNLLAIDPEYTPDPVQDPPTFVDLVEELQSEIQTVEMEQEGDYGSMTTPGHIGAGTFIGLSVPILTFADLYTSGIGWTGLVYMTLSPGNELRASIGYYSWGGGDNQQGVDITLTSVPLFIGYRKYFGDGTYLPYLSGEAGIHFLTFKGTDGFNSESVTERDPGFGAGGGILVQASDSFFLDLEIKYNAMYDQRYENYFGEFLSFLVGIRFVLQ